MKTLSGFLQNPIMQGYWTMTLSWRTAMDPFYTLLKWQVTIAFSLPQNE